MSYDFNVDEIFQMAERIEQNGASFYREAATAISDESSKSFLLELASMEDNHKLIFSKMRNNLVSSEIVTTLFDPHNEVVSYLLALADMRVFFQKKIDLFSMKSILEAAIIAEKDSIVFYLGMQALVPENMGKAKVEAIIKEEMSHVTLLSGRLGSFSS